MFKALEKKRPVQYCAGTIASIGEPKIAQNGKSYLTFKIEGVGASPKANLTVFFRPEWFMKDFNPSKLPAEEKLDYSRLVANTFRSPFLLPILQVILGDEGYKEFSRLCHERAQVTEEGIQEDLFEALLVHEVPLGAVVVGAEVLGDLKAQLAQLRGNFS